MANKKSSIANKKNLKKAYWQTIIKKAQWQTKSGLMANKTLILIIFNKIFV